MSSNSNSYHTIGLMSGTSLDGLDIAHVLFHFESGQWKYTLDECVTVPYSKILSEQLSNAVSLNGKNLVKLHNDYGKWTGQVVSQFISDHNLSPEIIASHGHTVFHQPENGFTYQIAAGQEIANSTGIKTVCDFRSLDVSLGGQGAPLVPIGDQLLFGEFSHCLNLGGIANVSFEQEGIRRSFDICVANMALNHICKDLDLLYDDQGNLAKSGTVDIELLNSLNELGYYQIPFPKSLGYEYFQSEYLPLINKSQQDPKDKLRTLVEHIAIQVSQSISNADKLLITGGGAFNKFLISRIQSALGERTKIVIPDEKTISFKEALIFAFLGVLRVRNEVNTLSSVTGASKDSSGGVIYHPN